METWQLFDRVAEEYDEVLPFFSRFGASLWRWIMSHGYRAFVEALPAPHRERFRQRVLQLPPYDQALSRTTSVWSGRKGWKQQV